MKGKIYKIVDNTNNNIYIGSTCESSLEKRLYKHKNDYTRYLKNGKKYITSFEILKNNNYKIELLEDIVCDTKYDLYIKEKYWIEHICCINKNKPTNYTEIGRTEYNKIYKQNNKQNFNKIICDCGGKYSYGHKSHHYNSIKHKQFLIKLPNKTITI
jgi:hypothetical protein